MNPTEPFKIFPMRTDWLTCRLLMAIYLLLCVLLASCGSPDLPSPQSRQFQLISSTVDRTLIEGDSAGLSLAIQLQSNAAFQEVFDLELVANGNELAELTTAFDTATLSQDSPTATLTLQLPIGDSPRLPHQREITIQATDNNGMRVTLSVALDVQPTTAPDVYLLIGQSNMVGFSGDGTKQAQPGGPDEPNPRILQLNASANDAMQFTRASDYTSRVRNTTSPVIVPAEDPLHTPLDGDSTEKDLDFIGLGLSFAKRALSDTTATVVLVPAAWSGSGFCTNEFVNAHWNAARSSDSNLGNTLLFDRAITRTNIALEETGGILRGILWHQGEADSNSRCADSYANNITQMVQGLRTNINADSRGPALRAANAKIPFVVGTMSRGADARADLSEFTPSKEIVDAVHRNVTTLVPHADVANADDLVPANGFPCGNTTCIHFGAAALRELGARYYSALQNALSDP